MASSSFATVVFEPNQVSSSVSADASLRFLEEHGFFYQENAAIGNLVDELYSQGRARSDDARLKYFLPTLNQDPRLKSILDHYVELPRFRFPWGTTPDYYNWDIASSPKADRGLVAYMTSSKSNWYCRDGSLDLGSDGELVANGTFRLPDNLLEQYPTYEVTMEAGGILLVRTRLAHSAKAGRSIMLGLARIQINPR